MGAVLKYSTSEKGRKIKKEAVLKYSFSEKGRKKRKSAVKKYNKKMERRRSQIAYRIHKRTFLKIWTKRLFSINILKKYKRMRANASVRNAATHLSKKKTYFWKKNQIKLKQKELMKLIRDHSTSDIIKNAFLKTSSVFDFKKQKSGFTFPTMCRTKIPRRNVGATFNINRYICERTNEFRRTVAEYLIPKVYHTQRKILLNYLPYKYFEKHGKKAPYSKYLTATLVSRHLAATISHRRAEWINIHFYNFHIIGDSANNFLAKETLAAVEHKKNALLGMECHQRGVEPYFPLTAFVSGKNYEYLNCKNVKKGHKIKSETKCKEVGVDKNYSSDTNNLVVEDVLKPKIYECTDDCIKTSDKECDQFKNIIYTFSNSTQTNIRKVLDKYDACSNMNMDEIYLLPCEKRNHSRICHEQGCESSSVLLRKLAIHHKNCRRAMKILTELNIANQFIHDIDVATVLGDIDYLIKLLAFSPTKQPSIFNSNEAPSIDIEEQKIFYADHIATYKVRCLDLPDIVCQSCDILERETNISDPKDTWVHINNSAWKRLKNMLCIQNFNHENIRICSYCVTNYNSDKIPPRSKLNNMDPGDLPNEISILTPIEIMFISKAKVFQSVIKLGKVGRHAPSNSRLSALKGNCIHMPLPLEQTLKHLDENTGFSKLPSNYIITHQIKNNELLLRNLVDLNKVYAALVWLKKNNPFYFEIELPPRAELLFSSPSNEKSALESFPVTSGNDNKNDCVSNETLNPKDNMKDETENNPSKMIEKLSSLEVQSALEQFSVVENDLKGKSIMDVEDFYKLMKIDLEPLSYREKMVDLMAFPNIFPYGKAGQNSDREVNLQPKMFEKTRLLSSRSELRRNMQYLFYLVQIYEKRLINQGVFATMKNVKCFDGKTVGQLLKLLKEDNKTIEKNLNRVVSKIPNSPSYWNAPRSQLKCLSETYGPATFFVTFSPAEYDWLDLHSYLKKHNQDIATADGISNMSLLTLDPVLTSAFIHQKFQSLHSFILESDCLGVVEHWFYRIEYQSRGTPHFHCLYWIKDAPIIGQSSDETVLEFINRHITCAFPSKSKNIEIHELVDKYLNHKCGNYCRKLIKSKTGKFTQACRFGFPRKVTTKMILHDVVASILGRKSSNLKKRLYNLRRTKDEACINDYNPLLLTMWGGNMDIQFISEHTFSLAEYITKYCTKADKSHLSNDDLGLDNSIQSKLWKFAYRSLKGRELGAHEACDRFFRDKLYECSDKFQYVSTVFPKNRTRMMKNFKDLENAKSESKEIFNKDMLSTYYPKRPDLLENVSLKDYAASYERAYPPKTKACITLKENNGIMRKRIKDSLVYHNDFDPCVDPENYYFSLLLLLKPWRNEGELLGECLSYQAAFEKDKHSFPQLVVYDRRKRKIMDSKKKTEDEVSKRIEKMNEEGPESDEGENDTALDQVLSDFEEINKDNSISTEAELNNFIETLNPEQRRIYDKIISAIGHSVAHRIKSCTCDSFQPLLLYVSGYGGTGKSYLIKAIMAWAYITTNLLERKCKIVLAAPTGISAAGISGMTLHSALTLPIEHNGKMTYKPLTGANLQQIQACMRYVHCIMIDEISMVSNLTLLHIHLRLSEIFGSRKCNNDWFGSQNVIVFGDLLQLPPVKGEEVFISLSEIKVKAAIGMMSTDLSLFSHFNYDELTINQRQKNDKNKDFKDCLSRIRIGIVLPSDVKLLSSCLIKVCKEKPMESLVSYYNSLAKNGEFPVCLLPTRSMVREFNDAILSSRSECIIEIPAIDEIDCKVRKIKENARQKLAKMDLDDRNTAGLEKCLRLSIGARVMLRRNIDTAKKLVNGSTGTILNLKSNHYGQVRVIVIQFDGMNEPIEVNRDKRKICIFDNAYVYREQFPLTCAYSITIHKSQGLSLKLVMADLGDSIFSEGQIYVALSRAQTLSGLHLININFNKIKASPKALEFYASQSKQDFGRKIRRQKNKATEVTWYKASKRKRQDNLIKDVIEEEIQDVPSRGYEESNKTKHNNLIPSSPLKKLKKLEKKNEPQSLKEKYTCGNEAGTSNAKVAIKKIMKKTVRGREMKPLRGDSRNLIPVPQTTWHYNPVDINWQQERANSLGLQIYNDSYVTYKQPRDIPENAQFTHIHDTVGDGNCFFRAVSLYLTGKENSHGLLRTMVLNHMVRNIDQFSTVTGIRDRAQFLAYIESKKPTRGRSRSFWADTDTIIAMSSFLKTPFVSYAPQRMTDGTIRNKWCPIDGIHLVGETVYDDNFVYFDYTDKQIVLNNLSDHFEPADFE